MERFNDAVRTVCDLLWNFPMLVLLAGTHLYFTIRLGFIQRKLPDGLRRSLSSAGSGGLSPYEALSTALAATIGTGNIIGISSAIALGGPGAVFWCWISGFFGMATCYAESVLSAACRKKRADGSFYGGPMYVMEQLLHNRLLAVLFSVFTVLAALCVGSGVQAHSLTAVISRRLPVSVHWIGIAAALLAGSILIGGAKKTAKVCTCLVPVMSVLYLGSCLFLLVKNAAWIPAALQAIFVSAFSKKAVIGGVAGTAVKMAVRTGMAKGLFTNEAGMGSMPMTAAAAEGLSTRDQGLVSMTGVFWDTLVMCAVTALAILSDMVKNAAPYRAAAADEYCFVAFSNLPVAGEDLLSLCLVLFAFATIIGWSFYGECAARYLWGERGVTVFQVIYMVFVYLGSVCSLELVWNLSDLCNACMAVPNLWCLWKLKELIVEKTRN
ncbi:alanine/glycine:cation symporter family protein [Gallintestinimicrobium sp.]|uniref:alanine/glycine:cation symporter family protein n=1 Tax=Gallintestinimicrobium sp. TaxID=2981655 RepID=UPI0039969879